MDLNWGQLPFDYVKTDAHVEYRFSDGKWDEGVMVEDDQITIHMASTCLHYGQECFEGLKAYETKDGRVLAFRPEENAKRMIRTGKKVLMEAPPVDLFVEAVERVVRANRRFIPPHGSGASLYIRPLLIGTTGTIGIKPSRDYMFVVFCAPVGPYFRQGLAPIRLWVEEEVDRAAPKGVGDAKVGGNYAAGMRATFAAKERGFSEVLYLDSIEKKYIDESGATNFFGITADNKYVTPASGSILPSITNMSLMEIAKDLGMEVERSPVTVDQLGDFIATGCCGTASIVTPVSAIQYRDHEFRYTDDDTVHPKVKELYDRLTGIQSGDVEDTHDWNHEIKMD